MSQAWMRRLAVLGCGGLAWMAAAQKPGDTMFSLDPGGRGFGMGGAFVAIADDVTAAAWNPAGLAYLRRPEFQLVMRNLPSYDTIQAGSATAPFEATTGTAGSQRPTYFGLALPMKGKGSLFGNGTLAISYWRGGYYEKNVTASQLTSGDPDSNLQIRNKAESTEFSTDFYALSFGFPMGKDMKFGISALYAQSAFDYSLFYNVVDPNDPNTILGTTNTNVSENGSGFGAQVGLLGAISDKGNFGVCYRTEIKLHDFGAGGQFADTIPAKLSVGASYLLSEVQRGASKDFLVVAAEVDHFFSANGGLAADRKNTNNLCAGLQYTLSQRSFSLPVRLGVHNYEAGSDLFTNESVVTFGVGYRPLSEHWSIDFDFGKSNRHSGTDFSLSLGWQFGQ